MVSELQRKDYLTAMYPYGLMASQGTGIPVSVILVQWSHETGFGTSSLVLRGSNNHAGIKSSSSMKDFVSGSYSGYNSLDNFVRDYVRILTNLSFYKNVINVAQAGGSPKEVIEALHSSPWATDPLYGTKLKSLYSRYNLHTYDSKGPAAPEPAAPEPAPEPAPADVQELYRYTRDFFSQFESEGRFGDTLSRYGAMFLLIGFLFFVGRIISFDVELPELKIGGDENA